MFAEIVDFLGKLLTSVVVAVLTAWLTVRLSLRRFRSERWWEKKVAAYERVIEAFHKSKKVDAEKLLAEYTGREVPIDRETELRKLAHEAREDIIRASDVGGFILSQRALGVLSRYEAESDSLSKESEEGPWFEYLEAQQSLTHKCMLEFIAEAKADLQN